MQDTDFFFFFRRKHGKFHWKKLIVLIVSPTTYISGEAVLTSTHNVCFGSKMRTLGISLQPPFLSKVGCKEVYMSRTCFNDEIRTAYTVTSVSKLTALFEPRHEKTGVTAKLISAFVFATRIVLSLFFLNPKFQASSSFLCLYRSLCVGPVRKPHCWFSHEATHL